MDQTYKPTIIIDFDGVLHRYDSPWTNAATISDGPTDGAQEAVAGLREAYAVVVVSSRCHQEGGLQAIKDWLAKYEIEVDDVTDKKPPHIVVIDDRAIRFEGSWSAVVEMIPEASKPWNKKERQPQP